MDRRDIGFYRRSRTLCVKGGRMDEADIEEEVNMPMIRYQRLLDAVVRQSQILSVY